MNGIGERESSGSIYIVLKWWIVLSILAQPFQYQLQFRIDPDQSQEFLSLVSSGNRFQTVPITQIHYLAPKIFTRSPSCCILQSIVERHHFTKHKSIRWSSSILSYIFSVGVLCTFDSLSWHICAAPTGGHLVHFMVIVDITRIGGSNRFWKNKMYWRKIIRLEGIK